MKRNFKDKRLPQGITIYLNNFEEYVAIEFDRVAQICNTNVRMGRTINEAVENYVDALTNKRGEVCEYSTKGTGL